MPIEKRSKSWDTRVREALTEKQTTVALSEAMFGHDGLFAEVGRTQEDREKLLQHPLYQEAHARLTELRQREVAQFESRLKALESRPARLTIQIPRSLHAALRAEAAREGVSLSELVRLKLVLPYALLTDGLTSVPSVQR